MIKQGTNILKENSKNRLQFDLTAREWTQHYANN